MNRRFDDAGLELIEAIEAIRVRELAFFDGIA